MFFVLILCLLFGFLCFGILGLNFYFARKAARKPWNVKVSKSHLPSVSIIVPTHNESEIIDFKLRNLAKLEYSKHLMQILFIDSASNDLTAAKIKQFISKNPDLKMNLIIESKRKGKTFALNNALKKCDGEVVVISDADCFWPYDILINSLPYLNDPAIAAVSGPKELLNSEKSSVTKGEADYLNSMNIVKLGESKESSTVLFEGGFSAYKKQLLDSFDPYMIGSDDCGTVIRILEKGFRAIMVPEAKFFTAFPKTWKGKVDIKIRRSVQLVKLFWKYGSLLLKGKIQSGKKIVLKNLFVYLVTPWFFVAFFFATIYLMFLYPLTFFLFGIFLVPKVNKYAIEAILNYVVLIAAVISAIFGSSFLIWKKPEDRILLNEEMLVKKSLI